MYVHTDVNIGAAWPRCLCVCVCCHITRSSTRSARARFKRVSLAQPIDQPACQSRLERTAPRRSHWPPGTSVKRWSCSNRARARQRSIFEVPPRESATSTRHWWSSASSADALEHPTPVGRLDCQSQEHPAAIGRCNRRSAAHCPWIGAAARADASTGSVLKAHGERMSS